MLFIPIFVLVGFQTEILEQFNRVDFQEIGTENLLQRIDTKFVLNQTEFQAILLQLITTHDLVTFNGFFSGPYKNDYYDLPNFKLYLEHHRGKPHRFKIRVREYLSTGDRYLEVKEKKKGITTKNRILLKEGEDINNQLKFIQDHVPSINVNLLIPSLITNYQRITLKHKEFNERITFDVGLSLKNRSKTELCFSDIVIAEIKSFKKPHQTKSTLAFKAVKKNPVSFSKYCMGIAKLNDIKKNNFIPLFKHLNKTL